MQPSQPTVPHARIVVGGQSVPLEADVRGWEKTGLAFKPRMRRNRTLLCVVHWTGAENAPAQMHANMLLERLSVHFAIDQAGVIWQFCDADLYCAHAQGVNDRAVGIEIINRGNNLAAPDKGWSRAQRTDKIHGKAVTYLAFTPAQQESALVLVEALCRVYGLPMRVPQQGGDVYPTCLPAALRARYAGVVGHLQVAVGGRKVDPALDVLRAIHARGLQRSH